MVQAAVKATNYGVSLVHLEQFLIQADPIAEFGGLYQCEPAPPRHPDVAAGAPPKRCWLCAEHSMELAAHGGSVALGMSPRHPHSKQYSHSNRIILTMLCVLTLLQVTMLYVLTILQAYIFFVWCNTHSTSHTPHMCCVIECRMIAFAQVGRPRGRWAGCCTPWRTIRTMRPGCPSRRRM